MEPGWSPLPSDPQPYFQVDFLEPMWVSGVVTQGSGRMSGYLTKYRLSFALQNGLFTDYAEEGKPAQVFVVMWTFRINERSPYLTRFSYIKNVCVFFCVDIIKNAVQRSCNELCSFRSLKSGCWAGLLLLDGWVGWSELATCASSLWSSDTPFTCVWRSLAAEEVRNWTEDSNNKARNSQNINNSYRVIRLLILGKRKLHQF